VAICLTATAIPLSLIGININAVQNPVSATDLQAFPGEGHDVLAEYFDIRARQALKRLYFAYTCLHVIVGITLLYDTRE